MLVLSANNKIAHLLRSIPVRHNSVFHRFITDFDEAILQSFQHMMGILELSSQQIKQTRMPERKSGLGLISSMHMSAPAFIGSSRQALQELTSRGITSNALSTLFINSQLNPELQWTKDIQNSWNSLRNIGSQNNNALNFPEWSSQSFMDQQPRHLQQKLYHGLVDQEFQNLLENSDQTNKIRILSCSATGSAAFLRAPAFIQGLFFSNEEFMIAVKIRIVAALNLLCPPRCICGAVFEDHADHLFKCRIGPEWEQRHSAIVHCVASILRSTNLIVQHEVPLATLGPLRDLASTGNERMDLTITSGDLTPTLADVTVTHPLISLPVSNNSQMITPLYFAKRREEAKIRKYGDRAAQIRQLFLPMVLETYGASGPKFSTFLKTLAHRATLQSSPSHKAQLIRFWRMKISACLQRANSRLIINKANRIRSRSRQGTPPIDASFSMILNLQ